MAEAFAPPVRRIENASSFEGAADIAPSAYVLKHLLQYRAHFNFRAKEREKSLARQAAIRHHQTNISHPTILGLHLARIVWAGK